MKYKPEYICRICGYGDHQPFWLNTGGPSWQICLCCGGQSGYTDLKQISIERKRKSWAEGGYKWFDEKAKPKNWDLEEQMGKILKKYK